MEPAIVSSEQKTIEHIKTWAFKLNDIADGVIRQLEVVSSHFSYQEEYVWNKSIAWLTRKYEQALRAQHESYAQNANSITSGVFNSVMAAVSSVFGEKVDVSEMMVKGYEETLKEQKTNSNEKAQDSDSGKYKMSFIEKARAAQLKQQG